MSRLEFIGPILTGIQIEPIVTTKLVPSDCNAMIFINQGSSVVVLDSLLSIAPGQHFSVPGEVFEILKKQWQVSFSGTGTNNLVIIRKIYQGVNV